MGKQYTTQRLNIPIKGGGRKLLLLRPAKDARPGEKTPGILWIHGGGYATGMASMVHFSRARALVEKYGAVVVAPEYRLSGKAPYPAALEDCYSALLYLKNHAEELGVNPAQLMVGGESAGGGLTVALCLLARDRGEVNIAYQMPLYPMLDDRDTDSSRKNYSLPWNTFFNHAAWKMYLRNVEGDAPPFYAAPARCEDYSGLPPAYTFVGSKEPFYCETLAYIDNLKKAGIEASVDVYPTSMHAFDMLAPFRKISKEAISRFEERYLYAAEHYFAEQDG